MILNKEIVLDWCSNNMDELYSLPLATVIEMNNISDDVLYALLFCSFEEAYNKLRELGYVDVDLFTI